MKRIGCYLLLLCTVCWSAYAFDGIRPDGHVSGREYAQKPSVLISATDETNNDVTAAYLFCVVSPADQSIYVGLRYECADYKVWVEQQTADEDTTQTASERKQMTGMELSINGDRCLTAWMDGTVTDMDADRYDADVGFRFYPSADSRQPQLNTFDGEVRLGIKRWIPYNSVLEIRILDCKGVPSNYYAVAVYPSPTAGRDPAPAQNNVTVKTTVPAKVTQAPADAPARQTHAVITAAAGTARSTSAAPESTTQRTTATAKPQRTTAKEAKADKSTTAFASNAAAVVTTAPTTEPEATTSAETVTADVRAAEGAQRYLMMGKVRLVGTSLAASLLTGAVMIAVFAGLRKKHAAPEPPAATQASLFDDIPPDDDF